MPGRSDLWTIVLVTVLSVLIWTWAVNETRESRPISPTIRFVTIDDADWIISPGELTLNNVTIEGSPLALGNALQLARRDFEFELGTEGLPPPAEGSLTLDLEEVLRSFAPLARTGVNVLAVEPATVELTIDRLITQRVPIRPSTIGIEAEGEITVTPAEAELRMPNRLWQIWRDVSIDAVVEPRNLGTLQPGEEYTINVTLRKPAALAGYDEVELLTRTATVQFIARSRIEEYTLDSVRVQVQSPPEDFDEYRVAIDEAHRVLRNVTVRAESDLIRQIAANEVRVMAVLQLSTRDKDNRIEQKPIAAFQAILPDDRVQTIDARLESGESRPLIRFTVQERSTAD